MIPLFARFVPLLVLTTVGSLVIQACATGHPVGPAELSTPASTPRVELLVREGCSMSRVLESRLAAALEAGSTGFDIVDQEALEPDDPRRGFPTPTVLVDGSDLFGLPHPTPPFPAPS